MIVHVFIVADQVPNEDASGLRGVLQSEQSVHHDLLEVACEENCLNTGKTYEMIVLLSQTVRPECPVALHMCPVCCHMGTLQPHATAVLGCLCFPLGVFSYRPHRCIGPGRFDLGFRTGGRFDRPCTCWTSGVINPSMDSRVMGMRSNRMICSSSVFCMLHSFLCADFQFSVR